MPKTSKFHSNIHRQREEKIFKFLMWKQWKSKEREIFKKGKYQDFFEKLKGRT